MANTFNGAGCVLTIDTAITDLTELRALLPVGYENKLHVKCVKFFGAEQDGDAVVVSNSDDDAAILWQATSLAGDTIIDSTCRSWPKGFLVPVLESGTLEITLE